MAPPVVVPRHRARRIAVFNHKGGVGKTTLTVNIASALASLNQRVLLVDSDPQCNLTSYLIEESVVDDLLDGSDSRDGQTLWSAVRPIAEATGDVRDIDALEFGRRRMYLLPGDIRLSEFEGDLVQFWGECLQRRPRGFRGTAALSLLVNRVCSQYDIDFVFFDSGPNIGALNRVVILDCDFLIVPAACDLFSVRAMKTLGHTLESWITDWRTIKELAPEGTYLLPGLPSVLGYVPQRFRIYRGMPVSGQSKYLPRIERQFLGEIVSNLKKIEPSLVPGAGLQPKLGQIQDFGTLATQSQEQGVPIASVSAGTDAQRQIAKSAFDQLAKRILRRVGHK